MGGGPDPQVTATIFVKVVDTLGGTGWGHAVAFVNDKERTADELANLTDSLLAAALFAEGLIPLVSSRSHVPAQRN